MEQTKSVGGHLTQWYPIRTARELDVLGSLALDTGVRGPQADARPDLVSQFSVSRSVASVHQASGAR